MIIDTRTGTPVYTYVIVTVDASSEVSFIHDRMPAILSDQDVERWLDDSTTVSEAVSLLRPYARKLLFYPVCSSVGRVGASSADMIEPLKLAAASPVKGGIASFFRPAAPKTEPKVDALLCDDASVQDEPELVVPALSPAGRKRTASPHSVSPKRVERGVQKTLSAHMAPGSDDAVIAAAVGMGFDCEQARKGARTLAAAGTGVTVDRLVEWLVEHAS
jgi:hypothetical protein